MTHERCSRERSFLLKIYSTERNASEINKATQCLYPQEPDEPKKEVQHDSIFLLFFARPSPREERKLGFKIADGLFESTFFAARASLKKDFSKHRKKSTKSFKSERKISFISAKFLCLCEWENVLCRKNSLEKHRHERLCGEEEVKYNEG